MTTNFEHVSYGSRRTRSRRGWSMTLLMPHTGIHGSPWYSNGISNIRARSGTSRIVKACQGLSRLVKAYQDLSKCAKHQAHMCEIPLMYDGILHEVYGCHPAHARCGVLWRVEECVPAHCQLAPVSGYGQRGDRGMVRRQ